MSIERLSGGLTPADGSDPRTFPEIFNGFADEFEGKNLPAFSAVAATDGQVPVFDAVEGVFVPGEGGAVSDATPTVAGVVLGTTSNLQNTALGLQAFESSTTADRNTAVGFNSLKDTTEGTNNTAVGWNSLPANTTGTNNTAVGIFALKDNTIGGNNTAFGRSALQNNIDGTDNVAVGQNALRDNTSGGGNLAFGKNALVFNTTGSSGLALGEDALRNQAGGNSNTAVGRLASNITTTGSNNATLGAIANPSSASASNEITLGNSNITSLRCNVTTISSLSDVRDKTDIVDTQHGLNTLNKIRPVDFTWARRDGSLGSAPDIGFIAQELAGVEDETGDAQRLRLTLRNNPDKLEATPGRLIPILVKAVQELSAKNDELEARIEALEAK